MPPPPPPPAACALPQCILPLRALSGKVAAAYVGEEAPSDPSLGTAPWLGEETDASDDGGQDDTLMLGDAIADGAVLDAMLEGGEFSSVSSRERSRECSRDPSESDERRRRDEMYAMRRDARDEGVRSRR